MSGTSEKNLWNVQYIIDSPYNSLLINAQIKRNERAKIILQTTEVIFPHTIDVLPKTFNLFLWPLNYRTEFF